MILDGYLAQGNAQQPPSSSVSATIAAPMLVTTLEDLKVREHFEIRCAEP